jgi:septum site-determining protein MinD
LSGKGGVGKTMLVANLGVALTNNFKKNVIVIDSNIRTSHLGLHLGLYEDLPVTLKHVLDKKTSVNYAIYIHPKTGIRLLPAPLNAKDVFFDRERFQSIIDQLKKSYNIILVDIAPGLGRETIIAASVIDEGIIVTTPDLPAVTDAIKTIELLKKLRKDVSGIVINRKKNKKYELTTDEILSNTECDLLQIIPEDKKIPESIAKGVPLMIMSGNSSAANAMKTLAGKIVNEQYEPTGWIYSLKKTFGLIQNYRYSTKENKKTFVRKEAISDEREDIAKLKEEVLREIKEELKSAVKEKLNQKMRKN